MSTQQTSNAVHRMQQHANRFDEGESNACVTADDRRRMIELGAYYRAEARGFTPGRDMEDWFEAESEIDAALGDGGMPDSL